MNSIRVITTKIIDNQIVTVFGSAENPLFNPVEVVRWLRCGHPGITYNSRPVTDLLDSLKETEKVFVNMQTLEIIDIRLSTMIVKEDPDGIKAKWFLNTSGMFMALLRSEDPEVNRFGTAVAHMLVALRSGKTNDIPRTGDLNLICKTENLQHIQDQCQKIKDMIDTTYIDVMESIDDMALQIKNSLACENL